MTRKTLVLALLVFVMMLSLAAPAFATVNPGQHTGWEYTAPMYRPPGQANGWIVDDTHNPTGQHNGWVRCG